MPCNSDHMAPRPDEIAMQEAAKHLVYLVNYEVTDKPTIEQLQMATNIYAKDVGQVEMLCSILRDLPEVTMDRVVYNGRSSAARSLADWWERHQKVDAARAVEKPGYTYDDECCDWPST